MTVRLPLRCGLLAALLGTACGDVEADRTRRVEASELCATVDAVSQSWQSAPWGPDGSCPWFEYQAKTALEVPHELGRVPTEVTVYVAFDASGDSASQAVGDAARVLTVTDRSVTVSNSTNQRFYARIVLR